LIQSLRAVKMNGGGSPMEYLALLILIVWSVICLPADEEVRSDAEL